MKKHLLRLSKEAKQGDLVELVLGENKNPMNVVGHYAGISRTSYFSGSRLLSVKDFVRIMPLYDRENTTSVTFNVPMNSIKSYNIIKKR